MSRSEWTRVVAACERSGLSHREFARRRDLCVGTLRSWMYRLRREEEPRLLPVRVTTAPSVGAEIVMPSGVVLRLAADATPEQVAVLVRVLG